MQSQEGKPTKAKLLTAVFLVILTVFAAEVLARVIAVAGQFNPVTSSEFADKKQIAVRQSDRSALIFLGSSYTESSVYADLLVAQLARNGYRVDAKNLAMIGEGAFPNVQLKLLEAAVDSGARPAAVFYDVSPLFGFMANGYTHIPDSDPIYLFAYRARYGELLRSLPQIILAPHTVAVGTYLAKKIVTSPDGWTPKTAVVSGSSLAASIQQRIKLAKGHELSPTFYEVLAPVRNYCRAKNIPFVLVWYPTMRQSDAIYAQMGVTPEKFDQILCDAEKNWNVRYMNLHTDLDAMNFTDCEHVNAAGADRVTSHLVQALVSEQFSDLLQGARQ